MILDGSKDGAQGFFVNSVDMFFAFPFDENEVALEKRFKVV